MVTRDKNCYCFTCQEDFHYLGIASHRAKHKRRKEGCTIEFTYGNIVVYDYHKDKPDTTQKDNRK